MKREARVDDNNEKKKKDNNERGNRILLFSFYHLRWAAGNSDTLPLSNPYSTSAYPFTLVNPTPKMSETVSIFFLLIFFYGGGNSNRSLGVERVKG